MSNPEGGRKIPHNWTKETLGECAITHMEQLTNTYFNYVDGPQKDLVIRRIIDSYHRLEVSVLNGHTFIVAREQDKEEPVAEESTTSESEQRIITAVTEAMKGETDRILKIINKLRNRLRFPSYL